MQNTHYYGDTVRMLFLAAALVMLVSLPLFADYTQLPFFVSVLAILGLGLVAGLTNPQQLWDAVVNTCIAVVGTLVFETYAVIAFRSYGGANWYFFTNLLLGFLFFVALYFSVKTTRWLWRAR